MREVDPCVFTGTWTLLQKEKEEEGELKEFLYGSPPSSDKRKKHLKDTKEKEEVTAKEGDSVTAKEKEEVTAKEDDSVTAKEGDSTKEEDSEWTEVLSYKQKKDNKKKVTAKESDSKKKVTAKESDSKKKLNESISDKKRSSSYSGQCIQMESMGWMRKSLNGKSWTWQWTVEPQNMWETKKC